MNQYTHCEDTFKEKQSANVSTCINKSIDDSPNMLWFVAGHYDNFQMHWVDGWCRVHKGLPHREILQRL